jgi:hypothetical protein
MNIGMSAPWENESADEQIKSGKEKEGERQDKARTVRARVRA